MGSRILVNFLFSIVSFATEDRRHAGYFGNVSAKWETRCLNDTLDKYLIVNLIDQMVPIVGED